MRLLSITIALSLCSSCVSQKWQKYDASQYAVSMEPSTEAYQSHVEVLTKWSESKDGLPAGVGAELGFYLGVLGRPDEAEMWFAKEVQLHPESGAFIEALRHLTAGPEEVSDTPAVAPTQTPQEAKL